MKRKLVFITVIAAYVVLAVGFRLTAVNQDGEDLNDSNHQVTVAGYPDPEPPYPTPPPPLDPPG